MYDYYCYIICTLFLTAFYAPIVPVGLGFSAIGLVLVYWFCKYLFLRRLSTPKKIGIELTQAMTNIIEFFPLLFSFSNYIFDKILERKTKYSEVLIVISLVYLVLPVKLINRKLFGVRKEVNIFSLIDYQDARLQMDEDYARCNPVTKDIAVKQFKSDYLKSAN